MPASLGRRLARRPAARSLAILFAVSAATAACNATGAGPLPTKIPTEAPGASSAAAGPSGPTAFASTVFGVPFTLTLPAGWKVASEEADMFAAYISTDHQTADAGIDIQLVPKVYADPCNKGAGTASGGSTAADLAAWMLAFAPLGGTAGPATTIGGSPALVVDEAFAGTPCDNPELWPTSGGWLDANERKRYLIFEAGGKRFVATIVSSDAKFAAQQPAVTAALGTLAFK